jgi:hypothetical protein
LAERRRWRDTRLAALAKLKRNMEEEQKKWSKWNVVRIGHQCFQCSKSRSSFDLKWFSIRSDDYRMMIIRVLVCKFVLF